MATAASRRPQKGNLGFDVGEAEDAALLRAPSRAPSSPRSSCTPGTRTLPQVVRNITSMRRCGTSCRCARRPARTPRERKLLLEPLEQRQHPGVLGDHLAAASPETRARGATSARTCPDVLGQRVRHLGASRVAKAPSHSTRKTCTPRRAVVRSLRPFRIRRRRAYADASFRVGGTGETSITRAPSRILTPSRDFGASRTRPPPHARDVGEPGELSATPCHPRSRRCRQTPHELRRLQVGALRRAAVQERERARKISSMSAATRANPVRSRAQRLRERFRENQLRRPGNGWSDAAPRERLATASGGAPLVDRSSRSTVSTAPRYSVSAPLMSFTESFTESFTDGVGSSRLAFRDQPDEAVSSSAASVSPIDACRREHEHGDALDDGGVFGFVARVVVRVARVARGARRRLCGGAGRHVVRGVDSPDPVPGSARTTARVGRL